MKPEQLDKAESVEEWESDADTGCEGVGSPDPIPSGPHRHRVAELLGWVLILGFRVVLNSCGSGIQTVLLIGSVFWMDVFCLPQAIIPSHQQQ